MDIFTIGHSNHSIEQFISLLKQHGVTAIADVRSSPFSRRFPQFNQALLKNSLVSEKIAYVFLGEELGARPKDSSCYVDGMARYELIAATEAFAKGLERLIEGAKHHQIALMCAEQDPITCHRSILVCHHLKNRGLEVKHILKNAELESHEHLEQRLLKLHHLKVAEPEIQLQLFNLEGFETNSSDRPTINSTSIEDLIDRAYQLQSEKIAYVEADNNADTAYE